MGDEQKGKRKAPDDWFGIPGSGKLVQSAGTFADELGFGVDIASSILKPASALPELVTGPSMHPALDLLPWETPQMPPGAAPGLLDKIAPWLSLGAGAVGVAQGAYGLYTGEGRALDNSLGIVSGLADTTAGVTGLAALTGSTTGATGALAAAATPAGIIAGLVGLGVYGERESTAVMQNDLWGDTINNWFTDDEGKPVSMYEAAWDQGGDMIDGAHDYMADTWLGEDVGGTLGSIGGGIGAGATLVGATAANVGIGAATAAYDVGAGAYELGAGAVGAISDAWNSDWW